MLPAYDTDMMNAYGTERLPSLTYAVDWENKRVSGRIDQLAAMRQAVKLILETERYEWEIYSWDYGTELKAMIGRPAPVVSAVLQDKISDALLADDRILEVADFTSERTAKGSIIIYFTVKTIFGETLEQMEVDFSG